MGLVLNNLLRLLKQTGYPEKNQDLRYICRKENHEHCLFYGHGLYVMSRLHLILYRKSHSIHYGIGLIEQVFPDQLETF